MFCYQVKLCESLKEHYLSIQAQALVIVELKEVVQKELERLKNKKHRWARNVYTTLHFSTVQPISLEWF